MENLIASLPKRAKPAESYDTILKDLGRYERMLGAIQDTHGTESLSTSLFHIWTGITDVFFRIGNNFKTNILKSHLDLKRSEIRFYSESYHGQIHAVENLSINQVTSTEVPVPSGMTANYIAACNALKATYTALQAEATLTTTKNCFNNIYRSLSVEDGKHQHYLAGLVKFSTSYIAQVQKAITQMDEIFTNLRTNEVPFTSAYPSMAGFRQVRQELLAMESNLQLVSKLEEMHGEISGSIENLTEILSKDSTMIDKAFLADLATMVRMTATVFEAYGITAERQCSLEHNHIEVIRKLWRNVDNLKLQPSTEMMGTLIEWVIVGVFMAAVSTGLAVMSIITTVLLKSWARIKGKVKLINREKFKTIKTKLPSAKSLKQIPWAVRDIIDEVAEALNYESEDDTVHLQFYADFLDNNLNVLGYRLNPESLTVSEVENIYSKIKTCDEIGLTPMMYYEFMDRWTTSDNLTFCEDMLKRCKDDLAKIKKSKVKLKITIRSRGLSKNWDAHDRGTEVSESEAKQLFNSLAESLKIATTSLKTFTSELSAIESQIVYNKEAKSDDDEPGTEGFVQDTINKAKDKLVQSVSKLTFKGVVTGIFKSLVAGVAFALAGMMLSMLTSIAVSAVQRWNRIKAILSQIDKSKFATIKTSLPPAKETYQLSKAIERTLDRIADALVYGKNKDTIYMFIEFDSLVYYLKQLGYNFDDKTYKVTKVKDIFNESKTCGELHITPKLYASIVDHWGQADIYTYYTKKFKEMQSAIPQLKENTSKIQMTLLSDKAKDTNYEKPNITAKEAEAIIHGLDTLSKAVADILKKFNEELDDIAKQIDVTDSKKKTKIASTEGLIDVIGISCLVIGLLSPLIMGIHNIIKRRKEASAQMEYLARQDREAKEVSDKINAELANIKSTLPAKDVLNPTLDTISSIIFKLAGTLFYKYEDEWISMYNLVIHEIPLTDVDTSKFKLKVDFSKFKNIEKLGYTIDTKNYRLVKSSDKIFSGETHTLKELNLDTEWFVGGNIETLGERGGIDVQLEYFSKAVQTLQHHPANITSDNFKVDGVDHMSTEELKRAMTLLNDIAKAVSSVFTPLVKELDKVVSIFNELSHKYRK